MVSAQATGAAGLSVRVGWHIVDYSSCFIYCVENGCQPERIYRSSTVMCVHFGDSVVYSLSYDTFVIIGYFLQMLLRCGRGDNSLPLPLILLYFCLIHSPNSIMVCFVRFIGDAFSSYVIGLVSNERKFY